VRIVFSHIAIVREESRFAVYTRYFKALALMAKNDIFFQFEGNLLIEFHLVLQEAMAAYGDWDGKDETYDAAIDTTFQAIKADSEYIASVHDLIEVARMTMRGENKTRPVSMEDVVKVKIACDLFLIIKARTHIRQEIEVVKAGQSGKLDSGDSNETAAAG